MSLGDMLGPETFPVRPRTLESAWEITLPEPLSEAFRGRMRRTFELVILVTMVAVPGREAELEEAVEKFAAASRQLPGMISCEFYRSAVDPTVLLMVERMADREVLRRHMTSDYFRKLQAVQAEVLSRPVEAAFYAPAP
jgi:quinol monooxygenase YgiN